MVQAWYMDSSDADTRLPHMTQPSQYLDIQYLQEKMGIQYFKIDASDYQNCETLKKLRKERGYSYEDTVEVSKDTLPDYDNQINRFFAEHLHADEEIRLILDGSGYYDARDPEDRWIRIAVERDDLVIIPAGIYHRFTLDTKNYVKANRYYIGAPVWTAYNRSKETESMDCRLNYVKFTSSQ